jgi:hypothetical protein
MVLYAAGRPHILFVEWMHLNVFPSIDWNRENPFLYWMFFCLPDGLWYFALLLIQYSIMNKKSLLSRLCTYLAVALPFVLEMLQSFQWIIGTFDWFDILTYLLILILFWLCVKKDF